MYSKGGKRATAEQKRWHERVRQFADDHGAIPLGGYRYELHHVKGATFKHNKTHIGEWWVLPIDFDLHNVMSRNPLNVTHFKKRFESEYGTQKELFLSMVEQIENEDGIKYVPFEAISAIIDC